LFWWSPQREGIRGDVHRIAGAAEPQALELLARSLRRAAVLEELRPRGAGAVDHVDEHPPRKAPEFGESPPQTREGALKLAQRRQGQELLGLRRLRRRLTLPTFILRG
jgi:hypothetical protein